MLVLLGFAAQTILLPDAFARAPFEWSASPPIHGKGAAAAATPTGLSPKQVWHAYGFDKLTCAFTGYTWGNSRLCGYGQVIAIVDAFDDPTIESDLATFNRQFGLPACTSSNGCFVKAMPQGKPITNQGWALEISLDVQWAHAVAPGAKILLVEAKSNGLSDLLGAIAYAAKQTGVHQVSMSWGGGEFSSESTFDGYFQVAGVSFFASSGDSGNGLSWPAVSPYVVSVGGTTLKVDSSGNVLSETAWSGSGGGISIYEKEPPYQVNYRVSSNGMRGVPDVSYDADPSTGFPIYDSTGFNGQKGWFTVGGTSAGAPQWAALFAILNSQRAAAKKSAISSVSFGSGGALYAAAAATVYGSNYRDITSGTNGSCASVCSAGAGYDFVTGLGSPFANGLVSYLLSQP